MLSSRITAAFYLVAVAAAAPMPSYNGIGLAIPRGSGTNGTPKPSTPKPAS
ncbi:hypothetical protein C8J56DRAFT_1163889 [Mycena floridula]|nr:hypothetical protein C8J56DRAFT_1163889 [Mycena floridula]